MSSIESNKTVVQRFFNEVLSESDFGKVAAAARALIGPQLTVHHPFLPDGKGGIPEVIDLMTKFRTAFPDLSYQVEDLFGEGDKIAVRWTATGTSRGDLGTIKATGRGVAVTGNDLFVVTGGRIVETWVSSDLLGLMKQLGAFARP